MADDTVGGEPIRRNLMVVSSIFLLYSLAGGEMKDTISAGIIGVKIHREWVIIAAAWVWFGYAWLRYHLVYGGLEAQFSHLLATNNSTHKILTANFDSYKRSEHFKYNEKKLFDTLGCQNYEVTIYVFPSMPKGEWWGSERGSDVLTGKPLKPTQLSLLGGWAMRFQYSFKIEGQHRTENKESRANISWFDAPVWRFKVIKQLALTHQGLTGKYFPLVYARFSLAVSVIFAIPDTLKLLP